MIFFLTVVKHIIYILTNISSNSFSWSIDSIDFWPIYWNDFTQVLQRALGFHIETLKYVFIIRISPNQWMAEKSCQNKMYRETWEKTYCNVIFNILPNSSPMFEGEKLSLEAIGHPSLWDLQQMKLIMFMGRKGQTC